MSRNEEHSVLEFLDDLIEDTPTAERTARRERLRLELARYMKKAREEAGLTQKEVAKTLDVTQAWVSKLESPNFDHKLESVLSYFDAIGGEMNLGVDVAGSTYQIWGNPTPVLWNVMHEVQEYQVLGIGTPAAVNEEAEVFWSDLQYLRFQQDIGGEVVLGDFGSTSEIVGEYLEACGT